MNTKKQLKYLLEQSYIERNQISGTTVRMKLFLGVIREKGTLFVTDGVNFIKAEPREKLKKPTLPVCNNYCVFRNCEILRNEKPPTYKFFLEYESFSVVTP